MNHIINIKIYGQQKCNRDFYQAVEKLHCHNNCRLALNKGLCTAGKG